MKQLNIRKAARERGIKLKDLAGKLGITESSLRSRASRNPRLDSLYEIAEVLECEVGDLFY